MARDGRNDFSSAPKIHLSFGWVDRPVGVADARTPEMGTRHGAVHDGLIDAVNIRGICEIVLSLD